MTENIPKDYMIVGADAMAANAKECKDLIDKRLSTRVQAKQSGTTINKIEIIKMYEDMFKTEIDEMTACNVTEHSIITRSHQPIVQKNFQIPKLIEKEIDEQVEQLMKSKVIETSNSPWASRIVPSRKKNGELRICIDYRALNEVTVKDSYQIPRIDEILHNVRCN